PCNAGHVHHRQERSRALEGRQRHPAGPRLSRIPEGARRAQLASTSSRRTMPCYRCGTRQVDPDRGSSPWLRAVRADRQVLICPTCRSAGQWDGDLDRCKVCASIRLVRRLGEVECRECGNVGDPATINSATEIAATAGEGMTSPGLAEEVEQ